MSLLMTVRRKRGEQLGRTLQLRSSLGRQRQVFSSVRKTTSETDRAVGMPSPGLPISLMSRHTQNTVFVPHTEQWRKLR